MEDIIKVIAGCRVVTVQKTLEVPQFLFSLAMRCARLVLWSRQYSSWTRLLLCPLFSRQVHMVPDVQKTFGGAAVAVLRFLGRPCDHAALMAVFMAMGRLTGFFADFPHFSRSSGLSRS